MTANANEKVWEFPCGTAGCRSSAVTVAWVTALARVRSLVGELRCAMGTAEKTKQNYVTSVPLKSEAAHSISWQVSFSGRHSISYKPWNVELQRGLDSEQLVSV